MTGSRMIRFAQALAIAFTFATLTTPALALGSSNPGPQAPDWFERAVAAHQSRVHSTLGSIKTPDWLERYATAHPFGDGARDSSRAEQPRLVIVKPLTILYIDDWFRATNNGHTKSRTSMARTVLGPFVDDWFRDPGKPAQNPSAAKGTATLLVDDWFRDPH
jgi:hypothetical protein